MESISESISEDDFGKEVMKRMSLSEEEFRDFLSNNSQIIQIYCNLIGAKTHTEAVFIILMDMLRNKIISPRQLERSLDMVKSKRDEMLVDMGIDEPDKVVVIIEEMKKDLEDNFQGYA